VLAGRWPPGPALSARKAGFSAYQNRCVASAGAGAGGGPEHADSRAGQLSTHFRGTGLPRSTPSRRNPALDVPSLEYIRARHNPRHESSHSHQQVIQQRRLGPETGAARIDVITVSRRGRTPRAYYQ
jgi:hypothetical protein